MALKSIQSVRGPRRCRTWPLPEWPCQRRFLDGSGRV